MVFHADLLFTLLFDSGNFFIQKGDALILLGDDVFFSIHGSLNFLKLCVFVQLNLAFERMYLAFQGLDNILELGFTLARFH